MRLADELLSHDAIVETWDRRSVVRTVPSAFPCNYISVTHNRAYETPETLICWDGIKLRGECSAHGNYVWKLLPCKRRQCKNCNRLRRLQHMERIALGIEKQWPCALLVGTFKTDVSKKEANRRLNYLVRRMRLYLGRQLEYAVSWEITAQRRLHFNLVIGPWEFIPHSILKRWWGARISVNLVRDSRGAAVEAAGSYYQSVGSLAKYMVKDYQMPGSGKTVNYSKGWPKSPEKLPPKGEITWVRLDRTGANSIEDKWVDFAIEKGVLEKVYTGVYRLPDSPEDNRRHCDCFDPKGFFPRGSPGVTVDKTNLRGATINV